MSHPGPATRIIVGVDGSTGSGAALAWAIAEAAARTAEIEAVYVWHLPSLAYSAPVYVPPSPENLETQAQAVVDDVLATLPAAAVKVGLRAYDGPPAAILRAVAEEPEVALVVVGARGHGGVAGLLLGSVSQTLIHECPKPLVIIPRTGQDAAPIAAPGRVVVGFDGSSGAKEALRWAAAEAHWGRTILQVVHAWSESKAILPPASRPGPSRDSDPAALAQLFVDTAVEDLDSSGVEIERTVAEGRPAEVLLELAKDAALLVVGGRGLSRGRETIHGSVSHACAHRSPVPVAIIPDRSDPTPH